MEVQRTNGRRFVIPDIHGCVKTFRKLVSKIELQKSDQLFLLGDYISRGPNSSGTLDYIIELISNKFNIYPLRGNHEHNFLVASQHLNAFNLRFHARRTKCADLLDDNKQLQRKYQVFFENLPYYFDVDGYFLVHAGFNTLVKPFADKKAMLEKRNMIYNTNTFDGKTIIFGHQPHQIDTITNAIETQSKLLPLDNGCVYKNKYKFLDGKKIGTLCCYNLDDRSLIQQSNID
ncbi:MAG: serine/threonine protein phosphatase [Bacteroidales bacterium]|nr:serine/threonine protein phosphatase [Bacteroidales bacterium]